MKVEKYSIPGLYYRYGKVSDDEIRQHLQKTKIVVYKNLGEGTIQGYYPLNEKSIDKIKNNPRQVSLTFDAIDTEVVHIEGLKASKRICFLVKSSSRFFLKPDIGEVFDAIPWQNLLHNPYKAIRVDEGYDTLEDTDGEHHLMTATLFL